MKLPKLTILMPVYNGAVYLAETLDSIFAQTYREFELLIVNDCSTDDSLEIIRSYDDYRVKIIKNVENLGQTKSLNKGIKLAHGEYIAVHDQDDISLPERLTRQIAFLDCNKHIPIVGTLGEEIDEAGNTLIKYDLPIDSESIFLSLLLDCSPFIHSSMMFRKNVILNEFKGYNEDYRFFQDYELWSRVSVKYELANINSNCVQHRVHSSASSKVNVKICNQEAINVKSEMLSFLFPSMKMKDIIDYSSTLRLFKPLVEFEKMIEITEKILVLFFQKFPNTENNEFSGKIISQTYYKIADIYSSKRFSSFKAFLLFKKYSSSIITFKKVIRLILLWMGGSELRMLYRKYKV